ncbi:phosphoribosyl transferase domain-containing protein [Corallococcus coralloides]|uniref:Phosphoribosyl transferase domain-containing protein n=1 Tax=Corallococcus coralloides TaxID=184914 RepID=A0A410RV12_CORCK|nr:phosphoribosyltransferase family protein [Corallococcus coralloides]QAT85753.1 phosphoribosyl transferase domain-containing protein [Corallococcus coralloides]
MYFQDRVDAGRRLARGLLERGYTGEDTLVVGLPRGGVPVAYEVAAALGALLDVCVVRKICAPEYPELGLGAVAEGGVVFLNRKLMDEMDLTEDDLQGAIHQKTAEVEARVACFRQGTEPTPVEGKRILLVDDGIATGATVRAALQALRARRPGRIVLAVPVAATLTLKELRPLVDDVVCTCSILSMFAIGRWYIDFSQVSDWEVVKLLALARGTFEHGRPSPTTGSAHPGPPQGTGPG